MDSKRLTIKILALVTSLIMLVALVPVFSLEIKANESTIEPYGAQGNTLHVKMLQPVPEATTTVTDATIWNKIPGELPLDNDFKFVVEISATDGAEYLSESALYDGGYDEGVGIYSDSSLENRMFSEDLIYVKQSADSSTTDQNGKQFTITFDEDWLKEDTTYYLVFPKNMTFHWVNKDTGEQYNGDYGEKDIVFEFSTKHGHRNSEYVPKTEPTCTEEGYTEGRVCAECGDVLEGRDIIPPLGHDYDVDGRCKRCGEMDPLEFHYEVIDETNKLARITACHTSKTDLVVPSEIDGYSITEIGEGAFVRSGIETVTVPESVTKIGEGAFESCLNLTKVSLPNSISVIEDGTFYNCLSLKEIEIPDNATKIGNSAFFNCISLESIIIPNSVTTIDPFAFFNCESLHALTVPKSVESIGDYSIGYIYRDGTEDEYLAFVESAGNLSNIYAPKYPSEIYVPPFENYLIIDVDKSFSISGYTGTPAEGYANENDIDFIALDEQVKPMSASIESSEGFDLKSKTYTKLSVKMENGNLEDYTYRFHVFNTTTCQGYLLRDAGPESEFNWYTGPTGIKTLYVDIIDKEGVITRIFKMDVNVTSAENPADNLVINSFTIREGQEVQNKTYVTLHAEALRGTLPYEYKFIVHNERTDEWYKIQDFSFKNTAKWYTAGADQKTLYVDVRDASGVVVRQGIEVMVK